MGSLCRSDNAAVLGIVNTGKSNKELAMHLIHMLSFYTAFYQFIVVAEHVAGKQNETADAISRNCLTVFHHLIPQANTVPCPVAQLGAGVSPSNELALQRLEESVRCYFVKGQAPQHTYRRPTRSGKGCSF